MSGRSITDRETRAFAYETARPEVVALVPPGARRILDLGCASGALGAALKARQGCEVVGVEADPAFARDAERVLDRVVCADLNSYEEDLGRFDCLVAADVLEHLVDPWAVLARWSAALEPGGRAVISLPNARHWEVFRELALRGTFPRRAAGIFDATHLRWFTLADVYGLCTAAGLTLEQVVRVPRPGAPAWTASVRGVRAFGAFQHVVAARRA
jgi:2-polyprenyl-3-methyl-5-hydroxy-6-metoxy-1,4-benzoquinol methylase